MVRGKAILALTAIALVLSARATTAFGESTPFNPFRTGNAEVDLDPTKDSGVVVVLDNGGRPNDVAQQDYISSSNGITGWNFKDFRFRYDNRSDTLGVAINFFGVAGDVDGDGNPGAAVANTQVRGGVDLAGLGGQESVAVAFYTNDSTQSVLFAGVSADKSQSGPGINGFNVANPKGQLNKGMNFGIERSFGQTNDTHLGMLAFDPSAEHPDFEFTIKNFSKLPGLQVDQNGDFKFGFRAYAGNIDDVVAGEDLFRTEIDITVPRNQVVPVPEPSTIAAWTMLAGLALSARRLRQRQTQS